MKKMSKKDNKGFSTTGLLAVIAIISVVICISLYFLTNIIDNAKSKSYQVTISSVEKNANKYVTNKNDEIFYLSSSNGNVEYQCITIGELIRMGYLDASIVDTEVDFDGDTVSVDDYIYIEKNANNKTILKSIYDKNNKHHCADTVQARGDITFIVSPNINTWSQKKTISIKYKIKNGQYTNGKNYQYKYSLTNSSGNVIDINTNANKNTELEINSNVTINAEILDNDGNSLIQKTLNIGMIDNTGPIVKLNGSVINGNINGSIRIPIIVTDVGIGINGSSIDKTDFEVAIGGTKLPISSLELNKVSEENNQIKYELTITDNIHRGKLTIKVLANSFFDNVENGNLETPLELNLTMNKVYRVIADSRGGTITASSGWLGAGASVSKDLVYGEHYGPLPVVSKPGYTFIGWYTGTSGGEKINPNSIVSNTQTQVIYARWQATTYKVVLVATGGTITSSNGWISSGGSAYKNISYGASYGILPTPTRTGYTFDGWWTTASSGGLKIATNTLATITNTQTLYARWTSATYTVTANATGGTILNTPGWVNSSSIATKSISYNGQYGQLPSPKKDGYTFAGWYTSSSGGIKIIETTRVTTPNSHTIYARWQANNYKIIANANGGSIPTTSGWTGSGASVYKNVTYNNSYGNLPMPTRQGYNFDGWYTSTSGGTKIETATKVNATTTQIIYARWTTNSYILTANANGGSITSTSGWTGSGTSATKNVTYTSQYGILPTPTRTGYTFDGWYTSTSGGTKITVATYVTNTNPHTIYARWKANNYRVTANANGGSITSTSGWTGSGTSATRILTYDTSYGILPTPTRTGYNFAGWYTTPSGGTEVTTSTKLTNINSLTIYAHWTAGSYKVTIDLTGGSIMNSNGWHTTGGITSKTFSYGSQYGSFPTVAKPGYTFKGWYLSASSGSPITSTSPVTREHTIYAQWTAATYRLTANANGGTISSTSGWTGSGSIATKNIIYGNQYGQLPTPTRQGYTFVGWYTTTTGGSQINPSTMVTTSTSQTIYARWTMSSYKVTASAMGGSITSTNGWISTGGTATKTYPYGTTYGSLPTATRPGYTFAGWYLSTSSGSPITNSSQVTNNHTIYARWTNATYKIIIDANGGNIPTTSGWTGSGASAYKNFIYGSQYGNIPTPTRNNYTFSGWYTATSGGMQILNTSVVPINPPQILYARWTASSCILNFNKNTTSSSVTLKTTTKTVLIGNEYGQLDAPVYNTNATPGQQVMVFTGWFTSPNGGTPVTSSTICTNSGTTMLYAGWTYIVIPVPQP